MSGFGLAGNLSGSPAITKARIKSIGPNGAQGYLTEGKLYEVENLTTDGLDGTFWTTSDTQVTIFCLIRGCCHLGGGDWELVEEDDE